jgi:hypothetical protein
VEGGEVLLSAIFQSKWERRHGEIEAGHYTHQDDGLPMPKGLDCDRKCPFCDGALRKYQRGFGVSQINRVVMVLSVGPDVAQLLVHAVPLTHDVMSCAECRVGFTAPVIDD